MNNRNDKGKFISKEHAQALLNYDKMVAEQEIEGLLRRMGRDATEQQMQLLLLELHKRTLDKFPTRPEVDEDQDSAIFGAKSNNNWR